jgi:hypothetical protein
MGTTNHALRLVTVESAGTLIAAMTSSTGALPVAEADSLTVPVTNTTTGRFAFANQPGFLTLIAPIGTGSAGNTVTFSVKRWHEIVSVPSIGQAQYRPEHLFSGTYNLSSLSTGVATGVLPVATRHATGIVISANSMPAPYPRLQGAALSDSAQMLAFDPGDAAYTTIDLLCPGSTTAGILYGFLAIK